MNKKIIFIILAIVIILVVAIGGIVFLNNNNEGNSTQPFNSSNKSSNDGTTSSTQQAESIEDLPKYNNYKLYEIKDAVNEDWFTKIGEVGELKKSASTDNPFNYSDVILGYNEKTKKQYLYPDAIIIQGKNDKKEFEQTVIKKEQYDTGDGYEFVKNVLKISGSTDDEIEEIILDNFKITDEDINKEVESLSKYSETSAQKYKDRMTVPHSNTVSKQMPWNFYKNLRADAFNFKVEAWEVPNEMNEIATYSFNISGNCGDQYKDFGGEYRIILVYDDLKANVNISYSENDDVKYYAKFYYYSGILDKDAYEKYSNSED